MHDFFSFSLSFSFIPFVFRSRYSFTVTQQHSTRGKWTTSKYYTFLLLDFVSLNQLKLRKKREKKNTKLTCTHLFTCICVYRGLVSFIFFSMLELCIFPNLLFFFFLFWFTFNSQNTKYFVVLVHLFIEIKNKMQNRELFFVCMSVWVQMHLQRKKKKNHQKVKIAYTNKHHWSSRTP